MADTLTTTTTVSTIPNGTVIATDDAGAGGHVQLVKLAISTNGSATALTADNTDGLLVNLGTNNDVSLNAGTNAIGKLAANSGVDIGDVDVLSIAAGDNNIGNVDIVSGTITTVSALGNSTTGPQKAEDVASANADVGIPAMAVQKATPANTAGTDGDYEFLQMSAGRLWTSAVVDTALPAGTNAIGKLAANSGVDIGDVDILSIAAGNNNIGDVDVASIVSGTGATNLGKAEDGAHTSGDVGVFVLGVRNNTPNTATTGADADYSQISTDMVGGVRTALYETDFAVLGTNHVKKYYTSAGAATDGIIWSPAAGKRWYVTDIFINVSAAATVTLEDDLAAGDSAVWKAELAANSGWSHSFHTPLFSGEDAADLLVTTSAGNVYITVTGYEV